MSLPKLDLEKRLEKEYREGEIEEPPEEAMKEIGEEHTTHKITPRSVSYAILAGISGFVSLQYPNFTLPALVCAGAAGWNVEKDTSVRVNQEKFLREELPGGEYTVDSVVKLYKEK